MDGDRNNDWLASLQPQLVRRWLIEDPSTHVRELTGTVVSADISGFTRLAESLAHLGQRRAAETLTSRINRCFDPMIDEILRRGGDVLKFGGDALFILFDGDDHARQACAASRIMMDLLPGIDLDGSPPLSMTVGVATGDITLVLAGSSRRELVVYGPVIDQCLQLESDAEPGEILLDPATVASVATDWVDEVEPGVVTLTAAASQLAPPEGRDDVDRHGSADGSIDRTIDWTVALGNDLASAMEAFSGTSGENRIVTVAFVALETAELDAATVDAVVDRCIELCARYGTTLLSTDVSRGGIKLFLASGAPMSGDDDEGAMLSTLSKLVFDETNPPMRAGVNRGLLFAGFLGADRCRTFTVMGDATNLAARLLGKADERSIAVSHAVLDNARSTYDATELPPVLVRGRVEPVTVYQLGQLRETERRTRSIRPAFVGRDDEMATLRQALAEARTGTGQAVHLVGEAGVGASRLLEQFLDSLPAGVLRFQLAAGVATSAEPFRSIRPLVQSAVGLDAHDDLNDTQVEAKVRDWIERTAPQLIDLLPLVLPVVGGLALSASLDPERAVEGAPDRMAPAIVDLLGASLTMPTAIIAEDLQWVDAGSLGLITAIAKECASHPWLLVTSARSGYGTPGGDPTVVPLSPLSQEHAAILVRSITDLPGASIEEVARRSGGNPLFAIELAIARESGSEVADSIEGQITSRIDRLGHTARVVLRTAAALGDPFDINLLAEVLQSADRPSLSFGGLLMVDDDTVRFSSRIIRDVAYAGLPTARRQEVHTAVAAALEARNADSTELAWHYGQAGDHEQCWYHARLAAENAAAMGLMSDVVDQLTRAVEAADQIPDRIGQAEVLDALTSLFRAGAVSKRYDEALRAGHRALTLINDPVRRVELVVEIARTEAETSGTYREQLAKLEAELADCSDADHDAHLRATLNGGLAALHYRYGASDGALTVAERAATDARIAGAGSEEALARGLLVAHAALADQGDPRRREVGEELIRAAEASDLGPLLVLAHSNVGLDRKHTGDYEVALHHFDTAISDAERIGSQWRALFPIVNRASLLIDQGRWDDARPILEETRRVVRFDENAFVESWVQSELGELEVAAGHAAAGRPWLETALAWFEQAGLDNDVYYLKLLLLEAYLAEGRSRSVLDAVDEIVLPVEMRSRASGRQATIVGYAHLQQGHPELAESFFVQAVEATKNVFLLGHARGLVGLGETKDFLGQQRAATRLRAEADEILQRLGVQSLPIIPLPH